MSEFPQLLQCRAQCFRRLLMNEESGSQIPGIGFEIKDGRVHSCPCHRQINSE